MKVFALIMSIYLLGLSSIPCGDTIECNAKAEQKISATTTHQEHNHTSEACTPFCTCSCCVSAGFYQSIPYSKVPQVVFQTKKYAVYNPFFCSEVSFSIWQPPKIV